MPTRVACSVAMEMRVTEASIVKTKAEDIVERIRKKCAAFPWERYVRLILVAAVPNLCILMQLCPLMYLWTGLLRVQPLHFSLSTEDRLIKVALCTEFISYLQ
uniref:Uncharacterized protein n=1 Tax=Plectus sambesii TaxID=2011161 RepID=A0A914UVP0_9BILA